MPKLLTKTYTALQIQLQDRQLGMKPETIYVDRLKYIFITAI